MDIRRYFGKGPNVSSSYNTRKQVVSSIEDSKSQKKKSSKSGSVTNQDNDHGNTNKKRKRVLQILESSDSEDQDHTSKTSPAKKIKCLDKSPTPKKSSQSAKDVKSSLKSSTATKSKLEKPVKNTNSADFFGTKKVVTGSATAIKSISSKFSKKKGEETTATTSVATTNKTTGLQRTANSPKDELIILDSDWSDDESFAQLVDSGEKVESHKNKDFNKALDQLDRNKEPIKCSGKSMISPSKGAAQKSPLNDQKTTKKSPATPLPVASDTDKKESSRRSPRLSPRKGSKRKSPEDGKKRESPKSKASRVKDDQSTPTKQKTKQKLAGKTFVVTGQLSRLEREEARELIVKEGGRVVSAISGKVNYLVTGEEAGLSKLAKAEKIAGLQIINEDEFYEMVGLSEETEPACLGETLTQPSEVSAAPQPVASQKFTPQKDKTIPSVSTSSALVPPAHHSVSELMWVDKYRPASMNKIIGQTGDKSNANKLLTWLKNWHKHRKLGTKPVPSFGYGRGDPSGAGFRAALLSGPPGIGKTTTAVLVCKEAGFTFVETNASDSRNKKILQDTLKQALGNTTMMDYMNREAGQSKGSHVKHCIIMDEVDGMSGNEDRGGVQELIQLIKNSLIPVICICNDRQHQKIRSLGNHCFDLRFQKPRVEQIKAAMSTVCFKEGIQIDGSSLSNIIESSNHDVRQILHNLSVWSASSKSLQGKQIKDDSNKAKKDFKIDAFTACRMAFSQSETAKMSLKDKSDLFFYDYSLHPLFIQENYISASPHARRDGAGNTLHRLAKAARYICTGDVISKAIRSDKWGLLPMQAMFSSVLPCEVLSGHLSQRIEFPKWLGKFSSTNKNSRLNKELFTHMSLNISGTAQNVNMDYLPVLKDRLILPLVHDKQTDGVKQVVDLMEEYDLLKDDYDNILELTVWPGLTDLRSQVESKTKAAMTRCYNKSSHKLHYSTVTGSLKKRQSRVSNDDLDDEVSESDNDSDEEVIKALKVKSDKSTTKSKDSKPKAKASSSRKSKATDKKKK